MEKIQISEAQKDDLIARFKRLKGAGFAFVMIGLIGLIPVFLGMFGVFGNSSFLIFTNFPTIGFSGVGIIFLSAANNAIKKINNNEVIIYKTKCFRKRFIEYAEVANNDLFSKQVKKPFKLVGIIGSTKDINDGDDLGIVHIEKRTFYAFPLI